jgi:quercetin dioxygenase-like cupin family protein
VTRWIALGASLGPALVAGSCQAELPTAKGQATATASETEDARMWMTIGDRRFAVTLAATDAARALATRLPLSLDMAELNGNEKHADVAQPLPVETIRPGTIHAGDIMLYGTRTIVVFYETFRSNYSYTHLGHVDDADDLRAALGRGKVRVLFSASTTATSPPSGVNAMQIDRKGSLPSVPGPPEYFTGDVRIDMQFQRMGESRVAGAIVSFEPGARTAWHTHPLGQNLFVIAGKGWTQCEGEPIVEINAGDIVWCPPGHKHWHGATPDSAMTHIAVQEALDGKVVTWMEHVTDDEYSAGPSPTVTQ